MSDADVPAWLDDFAARSAESIRDAVQPPGAPPISRQTLVLSINSVMGKFVAQQTLLRERPEFVEPWARLVHAKLLEMLPNLRGEP